MTWTTFDSEDSTTWPPQGELVLVHHYDFGLRSFEYEPEDGGTTVNVFDEDNDYDDYLVDLHGVRWQPLPGRP